MGTTLEEVVEEIGGGPATDAKLEAELQTGAPPAAASYKPVDLGIDYESLTRAGSIMGRRPDRDG